MVERKHLSVKFFLCLFVTALLMGIGLCAGSEWGRVEGGNESAVNSNYVVTTNMYGGFITNVIVVTTNGWGYLETNLVNVVLLKPVSHDLVVKADLLSYDRTTGWIEARGHVVISKGDQVMTAVYARVNRNSEDVYAAGNVVFRQGKDVWEGAQLTYNFRKKVGVAENVAGFTSPFRVLKVDSTEKVSNDTYKVNNVVMTTCTNAYPDCHFHVEASSMSIIPDVEMKGHNARWYFGGVPVLYMPFWSMDLRDDFGWTFAPGYNSRMGAVLLSAYKYRINPVFRGQTHVDYRTRRGVAFGQDFKWGLTNGIPLLGVTQGAGHGDVKLYYLNDKNPMDDSDIGKKSIESTRYRVLLRNNYSLSDSDYTMMKANYLSDPDVLDDFFENEYRLYHIPENYFIYMHRGEEYTASLAFRSRMNDFFGGINRMPEASLEFMPQAIGESYFFYDGRTTLGNMESVSPAGNTNQQDYSVVRFDTLHNVSRPTKWFGFLNIIPRVGYRGTYFSKTKDETNSWLVVTASKTNSVLNSTGGQSQTVTTTTSTNIVAHVFETEAMYRNLFEFGSEVSFKAFKLYGGDIKPRRHVVEPYLNYTFIPEPNVLSSRLYQFDSVDSLGEANQAQIGVRNKIQKKIQRPLGYSPYDILDVDVYTIYNVKRAKTQDPFQDIWVDAEWRPGNNFSMDADAMLNLETSEIDIFNIRATGIVTNTLRSSLEFRYRTGSSSLLFGDISLFPGSIGWSPSMYARYEFEESRLEELGLYLRRTFDCMVYRTGLRFMPGYKETSGIVHEDDYRITFELWLTAFPSFGVKQDKDDYSRSYEY